MKSYRYKKIHHDVNFTTKKYFFLVINNSYNYNRPHQSLVKMLPAMEYRIVA